MNVKKHSHSNKLCSSLSAWSLRAAIVLGSAKRYHRPVCQSHDSCKDDKPAILGCNIEVLTLRSSLVKMWKSKSTLWSHFRAINRLWHREYILAWSMRLWCSILRCFWAFDWTLLWIAPRMTCKYWNEMSAMISRSRLTWRRAWRVRYLSSTWPTSVTTLPLDGQDKICLSDLISAAWSVWFCASFTGDTAAVSLMSSNAASSSAKGSLVDGADMMSAKCWRFFNLTNIDTSACLFWSTAFQSCSSAYGPSQRTISWIWILELSSAGALYIHNESLIVCLPLKWRTPSIPLLGGSACPMPKLFENQELRPKMVLDQWQADLPNEQHKEIGWWENFPKKKIIYQEVRNDF